MRYIAKQHKTGRFTVWDVYDTVHWSWPAILAGRVIPQGHQTEAEAQAVADELNREDDDA